MKRKRRALKIFEVLMGGDDFVIIGREGRVSCGGERGIRVFKDFISCIYFICKQF